MGAIATLIHTHPVVLAGLETTIAAWLGVFKADSTHNRERGINCFAVTGN